MLQTLTRAGSAWGLMSDKTENTEIVLLKIFETKYFGL